MLSAEKSLDAVPDAPVKFSKGWYVQNKGRRIKILWKRDKKNYEGILGPYDKRKRRVKIVYDKASPWWVSLRSQKYEFVDQIYNSRSLEQASMNPSSSRKRKNKIASIIEVGRKRRNI